MSIAQLKAWLAMLAPSVVPELLQLEASGYKSLSDIVDAKVSSPDLHDALSCIDAGLDKFAQIEINKLKS